MLNWDKDSALTSIERRAGTNSTTPNVDADTDGDRLPDGIDIFLFNTSHPTAVDVYVEVDWMPGYDKVPMNEPEVEAMQQAFRERDMHFHVNFSNEVPSNDPLVVGTLETGPGDYADYKNTSVENEGKDHFYFPYADGNITVKGDSNGTMAGHRIHGGAASV